mmetsp:Transcript_71493/g.197967  ORF Transcript_71493/g.197967 Transcript_71493/m.197967 type:complete len:114 (+) Transcript_71493:171-512(+)
MNARHAMVERVIARMLMQQLWHPAGRQKHAVGGVFQSQSLASEYMAHDHERSSHPGATIEQNSVFPFHAHELAQSRRYIDHALLRRLGIRTRTLVGQPGCLLSQVVRDGLDDW